MTRAAGLALLGLLAAALPAVAQDTTTVTVDTIVIEPDVPVTTAPAPDTARRLPITPRGAFIRSMILPGWGQSAFDANFRGGIYFAGWAGNWLALFKTYTKLNEARDRFDRRELQLVDSLLAASPDPDSTRAVIDSTDIMDAVVRADSAGDALRKLVNAREQQREDWIAWSLFWLLASGIDAYVTAHLYDFPAEVDLEPRRDGGVTVRLEVPLPRRRP